jgi:microcystin-dependent protein
MTAKKRSRVRITVPAVPDKGGANDPMQFRLYVTRGAADPGITIPQLYQGPPAATTLPTTVDVAADTTGTQYPPPDPNSRDFPGATPARFYSGMTDAAGRRKFEVDGFGRGRWPRIMPVGTVLEWTGGSTPPEGWVFADGAAVGRTAYPELAALYWDGAAYRYGNGDGTTTFNLPVYAPSYDDASVTTGVATAAAGFTLTWQRGERRGGLAWVTLRITVVTDVANGSMDHGNKTVATLNPGWRPAVLVAGSFQGDGVRAVAFNDTGSVLITAGFKQATNFDLVAGDVYDLSATYALPNTDPARRVRKIIYAGGNI